MLRRSCAVAAAYAVALTLAVVSPASAGVLTEDPQPTRLWLSYPVDGAQLEPGDRAYFYGHLDTRNTPDSTSEPVADALVELWARAHGKDWRRVATATSDENGDFGAGVRVYRNTTVQWRFAGDDAYEPSRSDDHVEGVGRRVPATVADSRVHRGAKVVVEGQVRPAAAGLRIALWRGVPTRGGFFPAPTPVRLAVGRTDGDGSFVLTKRFKHRGMKDLYVEVSGGRGYSYGQSRQLHVKVTRR